MIEVCRHSHRSQLSCRRCADFMSCKAFIYLPWTLLLVYFCSIFNVAASLISVQMFLGVGSLNYPLGFVLPVIYRLDEREKMCRISLIIEANCKVNGGFLRKS